MTLNGNFTLNFHYYEQPFDKLFYILTVESVYTRDQWRCRPTEADRDPQNILDPQENCGSFVDATSLEP